MPGATTVTSSSAGGHQGDQCCAQFELWTLHTKHVLQLLEPFCGPLTSVATVFVPMQESEAIQGMMQGSLPALPYHSQGLPRLGMFGHIRASVTQSPTGVLLIPLSSSILNLSLSPGTKSGVLKDYSSPPWNSDLQAHFIIPFSSIWDSS